MPQEQLFKELFREFLELFYPEVAARLNFDRLSFLDKELFTDLPEGARRLLRLHRRLPVFSIVVYLAPGAGGIVTETYMERLWDTDILTFRYQAVGLPDLNAADYETRPDPLSPALSALMRS